MKFSSILNLPVLTILVGAAFVVVDQIWIRLLPPSGLSEEGPRPTLFAFIFLRGLLFLFWLLILGAIAIVRAGAVPRSAIWLFVGLNALLLGSALYGFYVEPMRLSVSRFEMRVPGLTRAVRIVQLSDIHVARTSPREAALPGLVERLHPDMIVMTGDYLNEAFMNDPQAPTDLRALVAQLHAPLGIYAVNGNVETTSEMHELLDGLGVQLLEDKVVPVPQLGEHFAILGLSYVLPDVDETRLRNLVSQTKPGDFTLLLYHKPDLAYAARDLGIDLYLCGHTHGGQVRLPFFGALFTNSRYGKTFEAGLYHVGSMTLYVSRGMGFVGGTGLNVRFMAPPEIVVVDLVPGD